MAIGPSGKPTTTGMMDQKPSVPAAPDLRALGKGQPSPQPQAAPTPAPTEEPVSDLKRQFPGSSDMELEFAERAKNLTDEDTASLVTVLSPSVRKALEKIIPEFKPLMDAYGTNEANVVIPISIASKYAMAKYNTNNPEEALQTMTTDLLALSEMQPAGQMEQQQTTVPPSQPMSQPMGQPQGLMASPQNMEQV